MCWHTAVVSVGCIFFFQAEDGIRYLVRSRGLGDVYKRQALGDPTGAAEHARRPADGAPGDEVGDPVDHRVVAVSYTHLTLPTSDLV